MRKSIIPTKMQAGRLSRYCVSKLRLRGASERSSATYWNANREVAMITIKSRTYHYSSSPNVFLKYTIHPLQEIRNPYTTDENLVRAFRLEAQLQPTVEVLGYLTDRVDISNAIAGTRKKVLSSSSCSICSKV